MRSAAGFVLIVSVSLQSCWSFDPSAVHIGGRNSTLLPPLEVQLPDVGWHYVSQGTQDLIRRTLSNEIEQNICARGSERSGKAVCRILASETQQGFNQPLYAVTYLTLFLWNIIGLPADSVSARVKLRMEIYDIDDKMLKAYEASGEHTSYTALWWGYGFNAPGKPPYQSPYDPPYESRLGLPANTWAVVDAMASIKREVERDATKLRSQLERRPRP